MEAIPGSTQVPSGPPVSADTSQNQPLPSWAAVGRWEQRYGAGVKPEPFTTPIARAVRYKRTWNIELANACVTGEQLLAGFRKGRLWSFPLHQRGVKLAPPSDELQLRTLGHRWRMRGTRVIVLGWIATAMQALKKPGLRITHAELGELCGVKEDRIGQIMHDLRRYGLVEQLPSFEAFGKVTSQRANVYRVTTLAYDTYALKLDRSTLPAPESVAPRIARARQARNELRPNPESTPVEIQPSGESSARAREVDRSIRMIDVRTSSAPLEADESSCPPCLDRVNRRTETSSDGALRREALERPVADSALCPGADEITELELARRVGEVVVDVKVGVVRDRRKIDPDDSRTIDRHRAVVGRNEVQTERDELNERAAEVLAHTDSERERSEREQRDRGRERERNEEKARRAELRRQLDRRVRDRGVDDDTLDELTTVIDPEIHDVMRKYRESVVDENAGAERTVPRPRRRDPDDDFADVIEATLRSHHGKPTLGEELALAKLRRGNGGDDSGGGS